MTREQFRSGAFIVALAVGVTVGGVAAGALVVAPAVAEVSAPTVTKGLSQVTQTISLTLYGLADQSLGGATNAWRTLPTPARRIWIPSLLALLALTGFATTSISLLRRPPNVRAELASAGSSVMRSSHSGGKGGGKGLGRLASRTPSRSSSRTPKAVQALAESGTTPSEIAWRTGLSLDAVAMLISIGAPGRQFRPPTA